MKALYPGSFAPFHKGHEYVYRTAKAMFGEVQIAVFVNPNKESPYRGKNINWIMNPISTDTVYEAGLVSDFVKENPEIKVIVKGIRSNQDLSNEMAQAHWNEKLCGVKTVFIPTPAELQYLSSSAIREVGPIPGAIDPIHLRRFRVGGTAHKVYFGKIAIGKSTYLKNNLVFGKDADKYIFKLLNEKGVKESKVRSSFKEIIEHGNIEEYQNMIKFVAGHITLDKWRGLLTSCSEISALPMYWEHIPVSVKANFYYVKLTTGIEKRLERAKKRGLNAKDLEKYDKFWVDMPFVDEIMIIE